MGEARDVARQRVEAAIARLRVEDGLAERGVVESVADGVAVVAGLDDIGSEGVVRFDSGALGIASELAPGVTGVVLVTDAGRVAAGDGVERTGRVPSLRAGDWLLGRLVDPLGAPLDGGPSGAGGERELFRPAPDLVSRSSVDRPLSTGISVIDTMIPIGRGQRELVVGDRNVGKTSLVLDAIAAQRTGDVACVYVAIGQPLSRVLATRDVLTKEGCIGNVAIIAADASTTAGMRYLAPYAGAALAEAFRDAGRDVLVVYDDLTKHAHAYRELTLLLGRPSGREAFPGDIFYVHAELLERACAFSSVAGGRSITALPIVETTDSDISAYIPTNLISITDGQIYLDTGRFERNERPAVDIGKSVSRIGAAAQPPALRKAARNLRILMARFESLEALTRVGLEVEESTRKVLARGRAMRELLRQARFAPRSLGRQLVEIMAVAEGWLDDLPPRVAAAVVERAIERVGEESSALVDALATSVSPEPDVLAEIEAHVRAARSEVAR